MLHTIQNPLLEMYPFVEPPSAAFICPVVCDLLLQPQLTECCGNHFSPKAVAEIQKEGKPCPLCKAPVMITTLNKHFQRQVMALQVFCRHEHKGCDWRGELSDLERHLKCCPKREIIDTKKASEDVRYFCLGYTLMYITVCFASHRDDMKSASLERISSEVYIYTVQHILQL